MVDPLSVAALTLAVIEELIAIGERTAELISHARGFKNSSTDLHAQLLEEGTRTRLLRTLLFAESNVYNRQTLFAQFDDDVQTQIELLLGQGKAILQEGRDILERRYGAQANVRNVQPSNPLFFTSAAPTGTTATSGGRSSSSIALPLTPERPSVLALLRWSIRDKERVETILGNFKNQNDRIHGKIKLWCLAADLGVDTRHLKRLEDDETSRQLGFSADAALKLLQAVEHAPLDLEIRHSGADSLTGPRPTSQFTSLFSIVEAGGRHYLQETFLYASGTSTPGINSMVHPASPSLELDSRTRTRVNALAHLLHHPKEYVFQIPHCSGWTFSQQRGTINFLFEIDRPSRDSTSTPKQFMPVSLSTLFSHVDLRPSLGYKYRLAANLAISISQLHMVQWLHKSFRSDNLIFLPEFAADDSIDWSTMDPFVLGFEFSRQENDFSDGVADLLPSRDVYRHPHRQRRPEKRFTKIHDIYSLGVVLLEIGLWEPALTLEKNGFVHARDGHAIQAQLVKHAQRRLGAKVGDKYSQVVVKCLTGDFGVVSDTRENIRLQEAFRTQVIDVLEKAASSV